MKLVPRLVKSAHNRLRGMTMTCRGIVTRLAYGGVIQGGQDLWVGKNVSIYLYGELVLGRGVVLQDGCAIEIGPRGRVVIEDQVYIGRHSVIVAQELVTIGAGTLVAEHCTIRDQDHLLDPSARGQEASVRTTPVRISPGVWVGAGARILRGSDIGRGSVIGANAVVKGSIPERTIAVGVPARAVRPAADREVRSR